MRDGKGRGRGDLGKEEMRGEGEEGRRMEGEGEEMGEGGGMEGEGEGKGNGREKKGKGRWKKGKGRWSYISNGWREERGRKVCRRHTNNLTRKDWRRRRTMRRTRRGRVHLKNKQMMGEGYKINKQVKGKGYKINKQAGGHNKQARGGGGSDSTVCPSYRTTVPDRPTVSRHYP